MYSSWCNNYLSTYMNMWIQNTAANALSKEFVILILMDYYQKCTLHALLLTYLLIYRIVLTSIIIHGICLWSYHIYNFFSIIIIAKDCLRILKKVMTMPMICVWDLLQVDLVEDQTNNLQKDAISEPSKNLKKLIFEKSDQIKNLLFLHWIKRVTNSFSDRNSSDQVIFHN